MNNLIAFSLALCFFSSIFAAYVAAAKTIMVPGGQMIKITTRLAIINFSIFFAVFLGCLLFD